MKDLYTFDCSPSLALATYHEVREAYARLFDELKIPYLVAEADSGDIGGDLSHEFHFPTSTGEDNVISCESCNYVANEELAETPVLDNLKGNFSEVAGVQDIQVWRGISRDRSTLVNVWYSLSTFPSSSAIDELPVNLHAVKAVFPELDSSVEDAVQHWKTTPNTPTSPEKSPRQPQLLLNIVDYRLPTSVHQSLESNQSGLSTWSTSLGMPIPNIQTRTILQDPTTQQPLNLLRIKDGDSCPRCSSGTLKVQKAIELGHTFHLGTRYSDPLNATIAVPDTLVSEEESHTGKTSNPGTSTGMAQVAIQMGCHGIGVSRMIAAVADTLCDEKGLNWPRIMAPYEVVVIPGKNLEDGALEVYDSLSAKDAKDNAQLDIVLDDRTESFPWKMKDADLVGYPVIVVVGKRWLKGGMCEVQCRRLDVKEDVRFDELKGFVSGLLDTL